MLSGRIVRLALMHRLSSRANISYGSDSLVPPSTWSTNNRTTESMSLIMGSRCRREINEGCDSVLHDRGRVKEPLDAPSEADQSQWCGHPKVMEKLWRDSAVIEHVLYVDENFPSQ